MTQISAGGAAVKIAIFNIDVYEITPSPIAHQLFKWGWYLQYGRQLQNLLFWAYSKIIPTNISDSSDLPK